MTDQEIQPGARVRVTVPEVTVTAVTDGWCYVRGGDGPAYRVPADRVWFVAPPPPPEPPVGSWVEWQPNDPSGWPIALQRRQEARDGTVVDRWWSGAGDVFPWADLCECGTVTRLYRDGDQRSGPAISDGRALWMHTCGHRTHIPVARVRPGIDPNVLPEEIGAYLTTSCADTCPDPDARWIPLEPALQGVRTDG